MPPPLTARRRVTRALVRLLGPALLVVVIVRIPDRGAVLRALRAASWGPIAAATLLNLLCVYLKVIRWQILLRTRGIHYGTRRAWEAFLGSMYVGAIVVAMSVGTVSEAARRYT